MWKYGVGVIQPPLQSGFSFHLDGELIALDSFCVASLHQRQMRVWILDLCPTPGVTQPSGASTVIMSSDL